MKSMKTNVLNPFLFLAIITVSANARALDWNHVWKQTKYYAEMILVGPPERRSYDEIMADYARNQSYIEELANAKVRNNAMTLEEHAANQKWAAQAADEKVLNNDAIIEALMRNRQEVLEAHLANQREAIQAGDQKATYNSELIGALARAHYLLVLSLTEAKARNSEELIESRAQSMSEMVARAKADHKRLMAELVPASSLASEYAQSYRQLIDALTSVLGQLRTVIENKQKGVTVSSIDAQLRLIKRIQDQLSISQQKLIASINPDNKSELDLLSETFLLGKRASLEVQETLTELKFDNLETLLRVRIAMIDKVFERIDRQPVRPRSKMCKILFPRRNT